MSTVPVTMNADVAYRTEFDIAQAHFAWWFPAFGILFMFVGGGLIWLGRRNQWQPLRSSTGYFFVVFALLWTVGTFLSTYAEYSKLRAAYRNHDYFVIEGVVSNFRPMPYEGHKDECFSVQAETFCYSDFAVSAGFHNTASHGGPIREGLPVRVSYVGDTIVRLEVSDAGLSGPAQREAQENAARAEWQRRQENDPAIRRMELGFAIAFVFVTTWWNLQWRRFVKFWVAPPYKSRTLMLFRLLFAANLVGAVSYLIQRFQRPGILASDRAAAAFIALMILLVVWILVSCVEWMRRGSIRAD